MSDQDLERAKRTLRTYGIPFGESLHPCGHGCAGGDRVTSGPIAHAGDLWMLEACGRCLLGRATRHEPGLPIPLPLVRPAQLWLRHAHGSAHRVFFRFRPAPGRPPEVEGAPTPLLTACGHAYGWPSEPVWSIRHAFDQGTIWRCRLCASARLHLAAVEADQALVWDELLRRAQVALDEAGHAVPWERVS